MSKWKCPECGRVIDNARNHACGNCSDIPSEGDKVVLFIPLDKRVIRRLKRREVS